MIYVSASICLSSAARHGASQRSWPSRLTLPSHLLFSCCPAKGSSRRAVPSGEPWASTPKASRVELRAPPLPPDTHAYTHSHTEVDKTHLNKHAAHTDRQDMCTQNRVSGEPFITVTSPFVFIHTTSYSFIVALLFICSQESRKGGLYGNAEDVE